MRKTIGLLSLSLICAAAMVAQTPSPAPAPAPNNSQLNLAFLADVLRSAAASHAAIQNMNLDKTFIPNDSAAGAARTAAIMGAGAGVGAAIGEMSHTQKGLLIGAIAGTAGALIIDQILQHQAAKVSPDPAPQQ